MLGACNVSSKHSSLIGRFNMDVQYNRFVICVMYLYVVQDVCCMMLDVDYIHC